VNPLFAHPVGERTYDRTITVHVDADAVSVEYELEVNTATVAQDLANLDEEIDTSNFHSPNDYFDAFVKYHGPVFARNLDAALDGRPLTFTYSKGEFGLRDKVSLHCRLLFRAPWQPSPGERHHFTFKEDNYREHAGRIHLSLTDGDAITPDEVNTPSGTLQAKPLTQLAPGDEDRLRQASATFHLTPGKEPTPAPTPVEDRPSATELPPTERPEPSVWDATSLQELRLYQGHALWLLLAVAAFLGGAHALTPGHGKTLVAAYLVGERGTVVHALYLGVVTTVSHTAGVFLLAGGLHLIFGDHPPASIGAWIGLGSGLVIAGMGVWLLLVRLTGHADHVHLFGGHHHHNHHGHDHDHGHGHGHGGHYHDEHGHAHPLPDGGAWWRITLLGVMGGMVPCYDALLVLVFLAGAGLLAFALPILLAFSAGLAGVLVMIGIVVVKAKSAAGRRWGESRAFKALPIISAALVTCIGLWMCYHNLPTAPGK
jgi:ABC-type nickel/cobalt efflux system permease component RcnA